MGAQERILIAGVGNIFLGDDSFGVEVARRLAERELPANVTVKDFGIRGFDLAYALMEHPVSIVVDAAPRGGAPGTLYLIEVEAPDSGVSTVETHGMDPVKVLRLASALGGNVGRVFVVGCEPATAEMDPAGDGLSAPVAAAVDGAVDMVLSLVARIRSEAAEPWVAAHA